MNDETFGSILNRAKAGDRVALDRALLMVEKRLRRAARIRLSGRPRTQFDTSDLLQTTYLNVVKYIDSFRGDDEDSFTAWLTTVMENNLRDKVRSSNAAKRQQPDRVTPADPERIPADGPTPSVDAMRVEDLQSVGRALDRLPEAQREIIIMRTVDGLSFREIGDRMGRSEGAARMLYFRARATLALELNELPDDDGDAS